MKRLFVTALLAAGSYYCKAQVLPVSLVAQEQDQWCWAGCSQCILDYYGFPQLQCAIAEYARANITWMSFGSTNCCTDAGMGCNNPNYEAGHGGSIQDILYHFGHISSTELAHALSVAEINTHVAANNLFVQHWSWHGGGGHFVVGYGISGTDVYYMNPWPGEGMGISTYSTMVDDGLHNWDYTLSIDHTTLNTQIPVRPAKPALYPNPAYGNAWLDNPDDMPMTADFFDLSGKMTCSGTAEPHSTIQIDLAKLPRGIYIARLTCAGKREYQKVVIE